MKRIVVLIDGTWNKEGTGADTNVAKLDSGKKTITQTFIKANATDGIAQHVHYHDGVGSDGDLTQRLLGGAIGLGLKKIIQDVYEAVVSDFVAGDEIYILASREERTPRGHWPDSSAPLEFNGKKTVTSSKSPGITIAWHLRSVSNLRLRAPVIGMRWTPTTPWCSGRPFMTPAPSSV